MNQTAFSVFRDGRILRRASTVDECIQIAEENAQSEFANGRRPVYAVTGIDFRREGQFSGHLMQWNDF